MSAAHSPSEWAAYLSLGIGVWGAYAALWHLAMDLQPGDLHPRRLLTYRPIRQAVYTAIAIRTMIGVTR